MQQRTGIFFILRQATRLNIFTMESLILAQDER